jgi:hypothetical protein
LHRSRRHIYLPTRQSQCQHTIPLKPVLDNRLKDLIPICLVIYLAIGIASVIKGKLTFKVITNSGLGVEFIAIVRFFLLLYIPPCSLPF